mgnify:FL=1
MVNKPQYDAMVHSGMARGWQCSGRASFRPYAALACSLPTIPWDTAERPNGECIMASNKELEQQIAELQAKLKTAETAAASKSAGTLACKVSEKGALSVYGLQRFPVTLYREQWDRLIAAIPEIKAFMAAHTATLAVKRSFVAPVASAQPTAPVVPSAEAK